MNDKSINIYLVRHGEAAAKWSQSRDPGLSELGQRQAQQLLADFAEPNSIKSIYTSPLLRARENRAAWLREKMAQTWGQQEQDLLHWREQACQALRQLKQDSAIFSHYMLINAVVSLVTDNDAMVCFKPDNGSVSHFQLSAGKLSLLSLGREFNTRVN